MHKVQSRTCWMNAISSVKRWLIHRSMIFLIQTASVQTSFLSVPYRPEKNQIVFPCSSDSQQKLIMLIESNVTFQHHSWKSQSSINFFFVAWRWEVLGVTYSRADIPYILSISVVNHLNILPSSLLCLLLKHTDSSTHVDFFCAYSDGCKVLPVLKYCDGEALPWRIAWFLNTFFFLFFPCFT